MSHEPEKREGAAAMRTLSLLREQTTTLRADLARLRRNLADVQEELSSARATNLQQANEQLVMAALRAEDLAEKARSDLSAVARARQRDVLTDPPNSAVMLDRLESGVAADDALTSSGGASAQYRDSLAASAATEARVQNLREANEKLVVAALTAQELEADANAAHRSQIRFLAMAAHELRNPLTPLRIAARLLDHARTDETKLRDVQAMINRQVTYLSRLIEDLLDESRASTGKFGLERATVDVTQTLELAIETCRPSMEQRRQQFTAQLPSGPLLVHGDPVRLAQVFSNLLDNASKYTPEGGAIAMTASVNDQSLAVTVTDNGIGIGADALPNVFGLFVQDARARAHYGGGLGIGLAVVRELVEAHGGSVVARSAGVDQGSEFLVTLPLFEPHSGSEQL